MERVGVQAPLEGDALRARLKTTGDALDVCRFFFSARIELIASGGGTAVHDALSPKARARGGAEVPEGP